MMPPWVHGQGQASWQGLPSLLRVLGLCLIQSLTCPLVVLCGTGLSTKRHTSRCFILLRFTVCGQASAWERNTWLHNLLSLSVILNMHWDHYHHSHIYPLLSYYHTIITAYTCPLSSYYHDIHIPIIITLSSHYHHIHIAIIITFLSISAVRTLTIPVRKDCEFGWL